MYEFEHSMLNILIYYVEHSMWTFVEKLILRTIYNYFNIFSIKFFYR